MDPKAKRLAPIAIRLTREERRVVLSHKLRHESVGQCIRRLALVAASHDGQEVFRASTVVTANGTLPR